jgi:hypothetical protein
VAQERAWVEAVLADRGADRYVAQAHAAHGYMAYVDWLHGPRPSSTAAVVARLRALQPLSAASV